MTVLYNNADGGVEGAETSTLNSGGVSGNVWSSKQETLTSLITFAAASKYSGVRGYRNVHGTGSTGASALRWVLSSWSKLRARFYVKVDAYPTANSIICYVGDTGGASRAAVSLSTTGVLSLQDGAGTTVFTSSGAIGLNTYVRVELIAGVGTTTANGTLSFGWAVGEAAISNTFTSTVANTGIKLFGSVRFGKTSGTWNSVSHWDEIIVDDTSTASFIGSITVAPAPAPVVVPSSSGSSNGEWPPDPYREAWRWGGLGLTYLVSATFEGEPIADVADLRPIGGSITDTSKPGVRRKLDLELAADPGLFDSLSPIGTQLSVTCRVTYLNRSIFDIPMGVFDVDSERVSEGKGQLSLTASDRWALIQRARFLQPKSSTAGLLVTEQISLLIREVIGLGEPVTITATSLETIGELTWEKDRNEAIMKMAESIGAWVFFDRDGIATITDIPTSGSSADWLIDASPSGVLTELDRERSRINTRNVVIVESSASDEEKFQTQIVWDNDPTSPTYAGIDPFSPGNEPGPFGIVPYYFDTPILQSDLSARTAGHSILARVAGLASQVSLASVPNPAIDAFDILDVLGPRQRYDIPRVLERHVVDTVTHPLTIGPAQQIDARSTRTDDFV